MTAAVITNRGRLACAQILTTGYTPAGPTTMILMAAGHTFQTATDTVADVSAEEVVATGYARQVVSWDPPVVQVDGRVTQQSQALSFGLVGGAVNDTVSGCYLFEDSGDDATSLITACVQFVEAKATDGSELIIRPITHVMATAPF